MATLYQVLCNLQSLVSAATAGLISNSPDTFGLPLTVEVGLYWPSAKSLQNNVRKDNGLGGPSALISIYDRGLAQDSTRWVPALVGQTVTSSTMTAMLSATTLPPFGTVTLTLGAPLTIADAVALVVTPGLFQSCAVIPSVVAGDTPSTMATKLAAMVNTSADLGTNKMATLIGAIALGPVVTLTSLVNQSIQLAANVGNGGTQSTEIGRRKRHFQIVVWARTPDDRITVSDPIEALIAQLESNFGLTFPDGTMGRLTFYADVQHDEAVLSDTLRRDFICFVDYGINVTDVTYSILAPIAQFTAL